MTKKSSLYPSYFNLRVLNFNRIWPSSGVSTHPGRLTPAAESTNRTLKHTFLMKSILLSLLFLMMKADSCYSTPYDPKTRGKSEARPKDNEWKYTDKDIKAIRDYDKNREKWYNMDEAILKCQRLALKSYGVKLRSLLDKKKYDLYEDAGKFKALEDTKNHAFDTCMKAFETISSPKESNPSEDQAASWVKGEWKNNDVTSVEIRAYDKMHNIWINENQAIQNCKQKAQSNYESRKLSILDRKDFDAQADARILEELKAFKTDTFTACEKAFEK